jgi:hypothetical protein
LVNINPALPAFSTGSLNKGLVGHWMLDSESQVLGNNIVTNGTFDIDTGWTKKTGTTISDGRANFVSATKDALYQSVLSENKSYIVNFDVVNYTSGRLTVWAGHSQDVGWNSYVDGIGNYTINIGNVGTTNGNLIFGGEIGYLFTGSIDNVKVMEITGAKDLTPNGNDGTANGGITIGGTTDRKGKTGGATEFDGSNDYVDLGDNYSFITQMSAVTWIKANELGGSGKVIISKYNTETNKREWQIFITDSKVYVILSSDGTASSDKIKMYYFTYTSTDWNFLGFTWDSGTLKLYLNGVEQSVTKTYNASFTTIYNGTENAIIGAHNGGTAAFFDGSISDTRVYNRELNAEEIKLLYDQYKPKEASVGSLNKGLVLDMPLTTKHMKSSTVVSDRTPYGNDGTVAGAVVGSDSTSFDGTDDYVDIQDSDELDGTSTMSWSFWTKRDSYTTTGGIFAKYNNTSNQRGYTITNDSRSSSTVLSFSNSEDGTTSNRVFTKTGFFEDGDWVHGVVVFNSGSVDVYKNGELFDELTSTETSIYNSSADLQIGGYTDASAYFDGDISNVKIWNRALSATEVKLLYEKGRY